MNLTRRELFKKVACLSGALLIPFGIAGGVFIPSRFDKWFGIMVFEVKHNIKAGKIKAEFFDYGRSIGVASEIHIPNGGMHRHAVRFDADRIKTLKDARAVGVESAVALNKWQESITALYGGDRMTG